MRSLVLFIGCSFCISLAAYFAVQIIWGSTATANAPELTTVFYPILQKEAQARDIIRLSDMTWVAQKSAREIPGLPARQRLEKLTEKVFGISKDYHKGEVLLAEDIIWPEDPDFIAQILRANYQAVAVHFPHEVSSNLSFGMGAFVDIYLTNLTAPVSDVNEDLGLPLQLAASLRIIGIRKNTQPDTYLMVEGTDVQIKSVLKGMTAGSLKMVLTAQLTDGKTEELSNQALQRLKMLDAGGDRQITAVKASAVTIQRGGERDVILFSSKASGTSQ